MTALAAKLRKSITLRWGVQRRSHPAYLESALRLLRSGGLAIFDNTLWSGRVLEVNAASEDTRAIQALNRALKDDARVDLSLLPLGDGLTLCRKR